MSKTAPARKKEKSPSLRSRLNDETRRVILDAMIEQLVDTGAFEFSTFELARRANVSVRTIYRHFPTRESLFDALSARINEQIGFHAYPKTLEEAAALARKLFPSFDQNAPLVLAQLETRKGREFRSHARKERTAAVLKGVELAAPDAEPEVQRKCAAAITCLMSSDSWLRLRLSMGMAGTESGEAVAWAIEALQKQLVQQSKTRSKKR